MPPFTPPQSPLRDENDDENPINQDIEVIELDDAEFDIPEDEDGHAIEAGDAENVEMDIPDSSILTFRGHEKPVFTCAVSERESGETLVLTGGEDDRAVLWNLDSGQVVSTLEGFKDSVVRTAFSKDGSFYAACDMSGVIKAFKMATNEMVWEFETSDITWMSWHPMANILFATTVDSELWMWMIPSGVSKIFPGHGEKAETARILPDGKRTIVAYGDGTLRLFDLKSGDLVHNFSGINGHDCSIVSLDVKSPEGNLVAAGAVDGTVKLLNLTSGKSICTFSCGSSTPQQQNSQQNENEDEEMEDAVDSNCGVEAVLFSTSADMNFLVSGTLEGKVGVWDIATQTARQTISVGSGVSKMKWVDNSSSNLLLVATLDGAVVVVDVRTGEIKSAYTGHSAYLYDFALTSKKKLVTTSDDGTAKVFTFDE